jgi:hypothetical protein
MTASSTGDWPAFKLDQEWKSVLNLYDLDLPIAQLSDRFQKLDRLPLEPEVR